jgi:hypothetical protein
MCLQRIAISFQLLIVLITVTACRLPRQTQPPLDTLPDTRLFEDGSCIVGCWQGIVAGQTTRDELDTHPLLASAESDRGNDATWYQIDDRAYVAIIYFRRGVVERIILRNNSWLGLSVGQIIEALGEPEYVLYRYGDMGHGDFMVRELWINLYYPQHGYYFTIIEGGMYDTTDLTYQSSSTNLNVCIGENPAVNRVNISEPSNISQFRANA